MYYLDLLIILLIIILIFFHYHDYVNVNESDKQKLKENYPMRKKKRRKEMYVRHKNQEEMYNQILEKQQETGNDEGVEPFTLQTGFTKASQDLSNTSCSAVNFRSTNGLSTKSTKNFGNFGIIGKFPAIPICDNCGLEFDCVNYNYNYRDDKHMNVCKKCDKNGLGKNYNDLHQPLYVYARSAGKPRQCKRIF